MSDASSDTRPAHYKRIGSIVEGLTFVLFVGTLTSQTPYVMAAAVIWTIMALALPLIWRGAFTFSVQRTQSQEVSAFGDFLPCRLGERVSAMRR
jgi:hypothetical protein